MCRSRDLNTKEGNMALIKCPDCRKKISSTSDVCIHCGYKFKICPKCGARLSAVAVGCPDCGIQFVSAHSSEIKQPPTPKSAATPHPITPTPAQAAPTKTAAAPTQTPHVQPNAATPQATVTSATTFAPTPMSQTAITQPAAVPTQSALVQPQPAAAPKGEAALPRDVLAETETRAKSVKFCETLRYIMPTIVILGFIILLWIMIGKSVDIINAARDEALETTGELGYEQDYYNDLWKSLAIEGINLELKKSIYTIASFMLPFLCLIAACLPLAIILGHRIGYYRYLKKNANVNAETLVIALKNQTSMKGSRLVSAYQNTFYATNTGGFVAYIICTVLAFTLAFIGYFLQFDIYETVYDMCISLCEIGTTEDEIFETLLKKVLPPVLLTLISSLGCVICDIVASSWIRKIEKTTK